MDPDVARVVRRPSRLRALAALDANAESSAEALDRITRVACRSLDVPVVLVNLIGADRQHIVGCRSTPEPWASVGDLPLTHGFCPFALGTGEAYALADAREDPSVADNPAVREFGVVAYAGVPLRAAGGEPIGTLCAVDERPHPWSDEEIGLLSDLAASAIAELQLLAATRRAARHASCLRALGELGTALTSAATAQEVSDAVARAVDPLGAQAVWLWRVDASTLRPAAASAQGSAAPVPPRDVRLDEPLLPAQVARDGEPRFLATADAVSEGGGLAAAGPARAAALLPLTAAETGHGVLGVGFGDERELADDERDYLRAVAGVAGLALARPQAIS